MSVLLYGLGGRSRSDGDPTRLGRAHNKMIRRITKLAAYLDAAVTNLTVRVRSEQPSIEFQIRRRRLGLLQRVLVGGRYTIACRSVIFGSFLFGEAWPADATA